MDGQVREGARGAGQAAATACRKGGKARKGGRNGDAAGWPRGEAETVWRKTTAWGRMTAETERGRWGHKSQVSSDEDRGGRCVDGQGESDDASKGWSGSSKGDSEEETEEDGMTTGDLEEIGDTLTALPWGTQESGAGGLQGGAGAGGRDTGKSPSAVADEKGTRGLHGARPGQGKKNGVRR